MYIEFYNIKGTAINLEVTLNSCLQSFSCSAIIVSILCNIKILLVLN